MERRLIHAWGANRPIGWSVLAKRPLAHGAARLAGNCESTPAFAAQTTLLADSLATGRAARRVDKIDDRRGPVGQRTAKSLHSPHGRMLHRLHGRCKRGNAAAMESARPPATPPHIFSRSRRQAGFRRALVRQSQRDAARYILDDMVEDVLDRLEFMRFEPSRVLVVGDWTETLALSLRGRGSEVVEANVRTLDEEAPLAGGPFDLIVSLASLDRTNDLPGALLHLRNALAPGGILVASMIGAGSLANLRRAMIAAEPDRPSARMHPLVDNAAASALMQRAMFRRQVVDSRSLEVAFKSLDRLVSDLRDQGLGTSLAKAPPPVGKAALERARSAFLLAANGQGRVVETFEILTLTGWKD